MITISNLSSKKNGKKYIFSDLNLMMNEKKVSTNLQNSDVVAGNDIVIDYDLNAIRNSIKNILFQRRYLNPEKNVYLNKYIGNNVSEMNAEAIGEEIDRVLSLYEPRINIEKIVVRYNIVQMSYFIQIHVKLLNLNENVQILEAVLGNDGSFDFINR